MVLPPRFELRRKLGSGGMGTVYEALDRELGISVAVKQLHRADPAALARLKDEFRSLRDVQHPNLVPLGELIEHQGEWFFTMQYVPGGSITDWVWNGYRPTPERQPPQQATTVTRAPAGSAASEDEPTATVLQPPPLEPRPLDREPPPFDEGRLRSILAQLTAGLEALHAVGKVHRDVKPSNALVDATGHLRLCDFGLVVRTDERQGFPGTVEGTPRYIAPELARGAPLTPAVDWFAVGVVLYQCMTGSAPFVGSFEQMQMMKEHRHYVRPRAQAPAVPEDLDVLCWALLEPDPGRRADGRAVRAALGLTSGHGAQAHRLPDEQLFVGRTEALARVSQVGRSAFEGPGRLLVVQGESGVGKSALLGRVVDRLKQEGRPLLVLRGRCHERESVPYKAFDGVIDEVARVLGSATVAQRVATLTGLPAGLGVLFPTLRQLPELAEAEAPVGLTRNELRRQAIGGLRELLVRLSASQRLVLMLDDLQWADADSLVVLAQLLSEPLPPMLVLGSARVATATPWAPAELGSAAAALEHLMLGPLDASESLALAQHLLDRVGPSTGVDVARAAQDARGHPLFLRELLLHGASALSLDEALATRVASLPAAERRLATLVCVAGQPLPHLVMRSAAGLELGEYTSSRLRLQHDGLVRISGQRQSDTIEPYHDRVREAVVQRLDAASGTQHHAQLAGALEAAGDADAEMLAGHWLSAGRGDKARPLMWVAAEQAEASLAGARAIRLFEQYVGLLGDDQAAERQRGLEALARVLAREGRTARAARTYEQAAQTSSGLPATAFKRRAADCYLRSGHFERGELLLREQLLALGIDSPRSRLGLLAWGAMGRLRLRSRGLDFVLRDGQQLDEAQRHRVEALRAASTGYGVTDTLASAAFNTRLLLAALELGDRDRIVRSLMTEYTLEVGLRGERTERALDVKRRAYELAAGDAALTSHCESIQCTVEFALGDDLPRALEYAENGERFLRASRLFNEDPYNLYSCQFFAASTRWSLGDWAELSRRLPRMLAEAKEREDFLTVTNLVGGALNSIFLVNEGAAVARALVEEHLGRWPRGRFLVAHFYELMAHLQIDVFLGEPESAWRRLARSWPQLSGSFLLRIPVIGVGVHAARARLAIALARQSTGARLRAWTRQARASIRAVVGSRAGYAGAVADMLWSMVRLTEGDAELAERSAREARLAFAVRSMRLYAAAAEHLEAWARTDERAARGAWAHFESEGVRDTRALQLLGLPLAAGEQPFGIPGQAPRNNADQVVRAGW